MSAGSPAPVAGATDHECDAISSVLLFMIFSVEVDADKQTSSAVVLTFMLGTSRALITTDDVASHPFASVTVTL